MAESGSPRPSHPPAPVLIKGMCSFAPRVDGFVLLVPLRVGRVLSKGHCAEQDKTHTHHGHETNRLQVRIIDLEVVEPQPYVPDDVHDDARDKDSACRPNHVLHGCGDAQSELLHVPRYRADIYHNLHAALRAKGEVQRHGAQPDNPQPWDPELVILAECLHENSEKGDRGSKGAEGSDLHEEPKSDIPPLGRGVISAGIH
mmetsp:Transcript_32330/g.89332  ORF Transcript_32330/g.89332 Transcript_32330/m.89332 type:complete len:201 (-) Transcript_32330:1145-1747(-)